LWAKAHKRQCVVRPGPVIRDQGTRPRLDAEKVPVTLDFIAFPDAKSTSTPPGYSATIAAEPRLQRGLDEWSRSMKALSIRQPFAWLIVHGFKNIENRNWTSYYRGTFHVHAAKALHGTSEERERIRDWTWRHFHIEIPLDDDLQRGGIVGQANVIDVVRNSKSLWFEGPFGFVLDQARPLPFRPCAGQLGFFQPRR
jgi:hypothetical protein